MEVVDLVLVAFPNHTKRIVYLERVLKSLRENLTASRHEIRWLCSSESERDPACSWHGEELTAICKQYGIQLMWRHGKASLGANMNSAVSLCTSPYYVLHQDDYQLMEPLDLSPIVEFMHRHPEVDMHRLSYYTCPTYGTQFSGELEPGFRVVDNLGFWHYGDDVAIRSQHFVARHGQYIEGGKHGMSEGDMLFRLRRQNAIITAGMKSFYGHIGAIAAVPEHEEYRERAEKRSDK